MGGLLSSVGRAHLIGLGRLVVVRASPLRAAANELVVRPPEGFWNPLGSRPPLKMPAGRGGGEGYGSRQPRDGRPLTRGEELVAAQLRAARARKVRRNDDDADGAPADDTDGRPLARGEELVAAQLQAARAQGAPPDDDTDGAPIPYARRGRAR